MEKKWEEEAREKLCVCVCVRERERESGTTGLKQSNKGRIESKTSSTDLVASICGTSQEYQSPD
jgi:hypothetical protein